MQKDLHPSPDCTWFATFRAIAIIFLLATTAPNSQADEVRYSYDALGRLTQLVIDDDSTLSYEHDPAGNLRRTAVTAGADRDDDGRPDAADNCLNLPNPGQTDNDDDGQGDACDPDDDNDGVADHEDAFPLDPSESVDSDGDGIGDQADPDDDNDGIADTAPDNCPVHPNPDQRDNDNDGIGDRCDPSNEFCWGCLPSRGGWRAILQ